MNSITTTLRQDGPGQKVFVARQPIFDNRLNVFAYELLFRSGEDNAANVVDGNQASSEVIINAFMNLDIEELLGNKRAFLNMTEDFVVGKLPLPVGPDQIVIEILEDIEITQTVIDSVRTFSEQGYIVALDDYVFEDEKIPLFDVIDIVKLDFPLCDKETLPEKVVALKQRGVKVLAEKVETQDDFDLCKQIGVDYFQGYFFCKPRVVGARALHSNKLSILNILAELQDPEYDMDRLEELITQDVAVSYKLLRLVNSSFYGMRSQITSIRQAIVILGQKVICKWVSVIMLTNMSDKPHELLLRSLQRARMMQLLCEQSSVDKDQGFLVGLFSMLDAMLDMPFEDITDDLPLVAEIKDALAEGEGILGSLLGTVKMYEFGQWDKVDTTAIELPQLNDNYIESLAWAQSMDREVLQAAA